ASIVILRLFGTLTLETHTHEVITHALLQQQKWDDLRSAVQVDPMQPRFLLSNKWEADRWDFQRLGARLVALVDDNPVQRERLGMIQQLEAYWYQLIQQHLDGQPAQPGEPPPEVERQVLALREQADTRAEHLGEEIQAFIDAEEKLLAERSAQTALQTRQSI